MKRVLIIFILSVLAMTGCTVKQETVDSKPSSVEVVKPKGSPVNPPTVVHSPTVKLGSVRVSVQTTPAPVKVETPAPAQSEVVTQPVQPVQTFAPVMPTSVQSTPVQYMQKVDPYSGNPIIDCTALGMVRAEDYSCIPASFYQSAPAPVKPTAPVQSAPVARPDLEDSMQPVKPAPPVKAPVTTPKPPAPAPVVVPPSQPSAPVVEAPVDCNQYKNYGQCVKAKVQKNLKAKGLPFR